MYKSLPIKVGFIFFAFFQIIFKKSVDNIYHMLYNNKCKGDTLNNKERRKI